MPAFSEAFSFPLKFVMAGGRDVTAVDSSVAANCTERACDEDSGAEAVVSLVCRAFLSFWFKDLATLRGMKGSIGGVGKDGGGYE